MDISGFSLKTIKTNNLGHFGSKDVPNSHWLVDEKRGL